MTPEEEARMRRQDEKDEWGDDDYFFIPICPDCGQDPDECECGEDGDW